MIKERDRETGNFVLQFRDGRASILTGRPLALVVDIVEDLRAALDYMVFELSALNTPDLNERAPQFVIADAKEEFDLPSGRRLRYLTEEQKTKFIEELQPFNGNHMLATLRGISGQSKHRRLLSVRDNSGWDIHMAEARSRAEYKDWFMYPMEEGQAFFARPKSCSIILLEKYDVMRILRFMAEHVAKICSCLTVFRRVPVRDEGCAIHRPWVEDDRNFPMPSTPNIRRPNSKGDIERWMPH